MNEKALAPGVRHGCRFSFPDRRPEIPSQMTIDHDNSFEADMPSDVVPADTDSNLISRVVTAELGLLDMLSRLIVDAVQRAGDATRSQRPLSRSL